MATDAASILSIALQVVSNKVLLILGLGMSFGLFCWAMWMHEWIALAIAVAFAVIVFLPVLFKHTGDRRGKETD
jgi:hypothetical protein